MPHFAIADADASDLSDIADLFRAYALGLPVDLGPQGFEQELAGLPGAYAPPQGALLIARSGEDTVLGCIALRYLQAEVCEVKRLYVTPAARGYGVGKALVAAAIEQAKRLGYRQMKLDTLPSMTTAIALYSSFDFSPVPPYGSHPYPGLICLGKALAETAAGED